MAVEAQQGEVTHEEHGTFGRGDAVECCDDGAMRERLGMVHCNGEAPKELRDAKGGSDEGGGWDRDASGT